MKINILLFLIFFSFSMFPQQQNEEENKLPRIEEVPIYPGCEKISEDKRYACMNRFVQRHIYENFNVSLANSIDLEGGKCIKYSKNFLGKRRCIKYEPKKYKIILAFKIDKEGNVTAIKVNAPHKKLKEEGERVAKLFPKIKPGRLNGKPVKVSYSVPFVFIVE